MLLAAVSSTPLGKQALASSSQRSWQIRKKRATPRAAREETSQDNSGLPIIRESIRGRADPVLEESSGRNMTAEEPAIANRNLSEPRGGGGIIQLL